MKNYIILIIAVLLVIWGARMVSQRDAINNTKFDECMKVYKQSGAPVEAKDQIMRDCYDFGRN